jgi:hypothetical protein
MLNEHDHEDEHDNKSLSIQVEVWENHVYRPLQLKWSVTSFLASSPSPSSTSASTSSSAGLSSYLLPPPFSDLSGKVSLPYAAVSGASNAYVPNLVISEGWEWKDEWKIDPYANGMTKSSIDSSTDSLDEWCYGNNFETLLHQTKNRLPTGTMRSMSLVRRRRWIREKICTSNDMKVKYFQAIRYLRGICSNMAKIRLAVDQDCEEIVSYEDNRRRCHEDNIEELDNELEEIFVLIDGVEDKLQKMMELLLERGEIEASYSRRLADFSSKWQHTGDNPTSANKSSPSQHDSVNLNVDEISTVTIVQPAASSQGGGFFYLIGSAMNAVSNRLAAYSSILSTSLPADVSGVLLEVQSIRDDCSGEGGEGTSMRRSLLARHQQACAEYLVYTNRVNESKSFIEYNKDLLERKIHAIADVSLSHLSLSRRALSSTSSSAPQQLTDQVQDSWLAVQRYYVSCADWEACLLAYQAFIHQQRRSVVLCIARVASLLQSTIKVIAHEQARAWQDASSFLQSMATLPSMISSSTAVSRAPASDPAAENLSQRADLVFGIDTEAVYEDRVEGGSNMNSPQKSPAVSHRLIFPSASIESNHYLSYAGRIKYAVDIKPQSLSSTAIQWQEAYGIVSYDAVLHLLPPSSSALLDDANQSALLDQLTSIISIDISEIHVEPQMLPLKDVMPTGELIWVHPASSAGQLRQQTLLYQPRQTMEASSVLDMPRKYVHGMASRLSKGLTAMGLAGGTLAMTEEEMMTTTSVTTAGLQNLIIRVESSSVATAWMCALSNAFIDPNIEHSDFR